MYNKFLLYDKIKMKRICLFFIIFVITIINFAFANEDIDAEHQEFFRKNSNKITQLVEENFKEWIKKYQGEDVPENEKITEYHIGGTGYSSQIDNSGYYNANVSFYIENLPENSIWKESNTCYMKFIIIGDEIEFQYTDRVPRNYDKFLEKFEEYKKEHKEIKTSTSTSAEGKEYLTKSEEVVKLSNIIKIVCIGILIIILCVIIYRFVKLSKNKRIS